MAIEQEKIKSLPDTPGVYLFKKDSEILYVGKATSLRDRARSYFASDVERTRGLLITKMLAEATDIETEGTDSVLEALILEAQLIKKHQPPYNSKEKSDKSFNYVVITDEDYPRVFTLRERDLVTTDYGLMTSYGPFPHGGQLCEALKIVRKIFPFRGEKDPVKHNKKQTSYLRREIGLVPDFDTTSKKEYRRTIQHLRLLFSGKKKKLIKALAREMTQAAQKKEFEHAEELKRKIFALEHIRDVALIKQVPSYSSVRANIRIEAYDVAHTAGIETVGVMVALEDGRPKKSDYRRFKVKGDRGQGDTGSLREILERRLQHDEWPLPRLIVVDGGKAQKNAAEQVLEAFGYQIPVVAVTKNERHQPKKIVGARAYTSQYERDIIIANSEAHRFAISFHRQRRKIK